LKEIKSGIDIYKIVFSDTLIYYGNISPQGMMHGYGILLKGADKFEGYWDNDSLGPYGRHISSNGHFREGRYTTILQ